LLLRSVVYAVLFLTLCWIIFYISIYRLTENEVKQHLKIDKAQSINCTSIIDCDLKPGDILIRRYITRELFRINFLMRPYFTHSAIYVGDGKIVEAIGSQRNPKDDVLINILKESDWLDTEVEYVVIFRPNIKSREVKHVIENSIFIAESTEIRFGLNKADKKQTQCSLLIYNQFFIHDLFSVKTKKPKLITPDFLFSQIIGEVRSGNFLLIGHF
jgi:hypothetical protein